jgi:hypothetical protein|tara:strand:+ start:1757 stop:2632 length:876 start_codon:yes stop_codon:yes gene_type:complete
MVIKNKKGGYGFTGVLGGLLILFLIITLFVAFFDWNTNRGNFGDSLSNSLESVSNGFMSVLGPTLGFLLNLGDDTNTNFLMILTFILISIIIVGTLDATSIFGDDKQANLVNLAVGIIVSIIGIRFMPSDMWLSLTSPSSAFVATILVGAPFFAFFILTMKIKFNLARKLLWLFYLIFMSYLIFFPGGDFAGTSGTLERNFTWIYVVFLILAGIMMFFDSTVRNFWYSEKHKKEVEDLIGKLNAKKRLSLRKDINSWREVLTDAGASSEDKTQAKKELKKLENLYGDLDSM